MLSTIIVECYKKSEIQDIAGYLDDLCSPYDNSGWASSGIYAFWDVYNKKILYIGLAVDLAQRFRQHNGLITVESKGCKYENIMNYFNNKEYLGYTIFVQSPLSQPLLNKIIERYNRDNLDVVEKEYKLRNEQGYKEIIIMEGNLIEAHKKIDGHIPEWNKVGGAIEGQNYPYKGEQLLELFTLSFDNPIVARSTLREISLDPTIGTFEDYLHSIRLNTFRLGMSYEDILKNKLFHTDIYNRIVEEEYLEKQPRLECV